MDGEKPVRLGHGRGRGWGLDSDEERGFHGLGTDGKPSKTVGQQRDMTKQCLQKAKEATVPMIDLRRPEEGRCSGRLST